VVSTLQSYTFWDMMYRNYVDTDVWEEPVTSIFLGDGA